MSGSDNAVYDLAIIGGGINGAGIARDAALRGLRTLLLEAEDFGGGTSSWSSRLIHGGLRYLEYGEIPLVFESLRERRLLLELAPHLVTPLRLVIPLYADGRRPPWQVRIGMLAYDLLSAGKAMPRHRWLDRDEALAELPSLRESGLRGAAAYHDAQVTYAERLVIENIVDAVAAGAVVHNYSPVTGMDLHERGVHELRCEPDDGTGCMFRARAVINAAGPWVDAVLAGSGQPVPRLMGGTKGSHLVLRAFDGAPESALYVEAPADGRPVFIIPWNEQLLVGTTDIRYDGDPRAATASDEETDYLLATVNAVLPGASVSPADIHYRYAGVRPLPHVTAGPESAITRKHIIHRHAWPCVYSIIGGKLTTYRSLAEQAVDRVVRDAGFDSAPCATRERPLPGATQAATTAAVAEPVRRRLAALYGGRAAEILALADESQPLATVLDEARGVLAAEVVYALRCEHARTLTDLFHRRLMLGLDADLGQPLIDAIAGVAAEEAGWDEARVAAEKSALARWQARLTVPAPA